MAESSKQNPEKIFNFKPIEVTENRFDSNLDNTVALLKEALFNGNGTSSVIIKETWQSALQKIKVVYLPDFLEIGFEAMQNKPEEEDWITRIRRNLLLGQKRMESYKFTEPRVPIQVSYSLCSMFLQKLKGLFFIFKITQLSTFRLAMETLCDVDFNGSGNGLMKVTQNGVEFTVCNSRTRVSAFLCLDSTALQDFQCSSKLEDRFMRVDFRRILQIVTVAESSNVDSITIFHIEGSSKLNFNFGIDSVKEFELEYCQHKPFLARVGRIPDIVYVREAMIPTDSLRAMIHQLETIRNQSVSVNITEQILRVSIGERSWEFEIPLGQNHQARLVWCHLQMLKKASRTAPNFVLCFPAELRHMILTVFTLQDFGLLKLISETTT